MLDDFAQLPGVRERRLYEDDPDDMICVGSVDELEELSRDRLRGYVLVRVPPRGSGRRPRR